MAAVAGQTEVAVGWGALKIIRWDNAQKHQIFIEPTGHLDKRNSGKGKLNTLKDVPQARNS
jgi:hypothetical protein